MFCGTDNIAQNISHIEFEYGKYSLIFHEILSIPRNIVMDLNNVMKPNGLGETRVYRVLARNPPRTHRP
jgi:hypothetical protein